MSGRLYTGTSGYSYKEWKGSFFPESLGSSKFLSFYASRFPTVEINNTFYRFPSEKNLESWCGETPEHFLFAIKANQRITHQKRLKDVKDIALDFIERCRLVSGRLGPLLFQLPPYLKRDDERLRTFLEILPDGSRYAIEFRHPSWFEEHVLGLLRDAGVALVQSDDGKLEIPRVATADFSYVRLRRDEYGEAELAGWREWIQGERQAGRDVFVYLKHDKKGRSPEPVLRSLEAG